MNTNKVPVGIASKVGYALTVLGAAATAWASSVSDPSIPPQTLAIITFAAGIATNLGRQWQAPKGKDITPKDPTV